MTNDQEEKWPKSRSFNLRPAAIDKLKKLSERYGGVGRAIQTAVEILNESAVRRKKVKEQIEKGTNKWLTDKRPQRLFSFPVYARTSDLINRLSNRHYSGSFDKRNHVIVACIALLEDLESEEEMPDYRLD